MLGTPVSKAPGTQLDNLYLSYLRLLQGSPFIHRLQNPLEIFITSLLIRDQITSGVRR